MGEAWDYVCCCGLVSEPWNVDVACVCRLQSCTVRECDGDWICGDSFICDVCSLANEMAGCAGVTEGGGAVDDVARLALCCAWVYAGTNVLGLQVGIVCLMDVVVIDVVVFVGVIC